VRWGKKDWGDAHASRLLGIRAEKRYLQAAADYIMISPALTAHAPQCVSAPDGAIRNAGTRWQVARCIGSARRSLFQVTIDLAL